MKAVIVAVAVMLGFSLASQACPLDQSSRLSNKKLSLAASVSRPVTTTVAAGPAGAIAR